MASKLKIQGCIGCTMCTKICPELFTIKDKKAVNRLGDNHEIPEDLLDEVKEAMDCCPVLAISIE